MTDPVKATEDLAKAAATAALAKQAENQAEKEDDGPSITVTAHDITLERSNNEKIAKEGVRDWELDLLKAIHGEDRVVIRDTYDIELTGDDASPVREMARLKALYNRKGEQIQIVEQVFGHSPRDLAKAMGVRWTAKMEAAEKPQAQNEDNRPAKGSKAK